MASNLDRYKKDLDALTRNSTRPKSSPGGRFNCRRDEDNQDVVLTTGAHESLSTENVRFRRGYNDVAIITSGVQVRVGSAEGGEKSHKASSVV
jgi:hypothetical protein